jgi:hypothetical protein
MARFPHEADGQLVEVDDNARPLLDTLRALDIHVVSIASRLIDGSTTGDMHVCPSFTRRGEATAFLSRLIDLAVASRSLRESLTEQGHPQIAEIGNRHLVWWPKLKGPPRTMH